MKSIKRFVFNRSGLSLFLAVIFFVSFLPGLLDVKLNFGVRIWFKQGDPLINEFDRFQQVFGSDNTIFVGISHEKGDVLWRKNNMDKLFVLHEGFWQLPEVNRVESLFNFSMIRMVENDFEIQPFMENTDQDLDLYRKEALGHPDLNGIHISRSGDMINTIIRLKPNFDHNEDYSHVMKDLKELLRPLEEEGFRFAILGTTPVVEEFRIFGENDLLMMIPLLLLIVAISLYFILRSGLGLISAFVILGCSVISTIGLSGYLGIQLNNLSSMVPMVIIAIALADSIHLISTIHLHGKSLKENCEYSFDKNFLGTLLTSITTTLGFLSLTTSEIVPIRDFGLLCAFGAGIAWFYSILILIPLYLKLGSREHVFEHSLPFPVKALSKLVASYYGKIIISFILVTSIGLWFALKNHVNSNPFEYISHKTKIYTDNQLMNTKFGGFSSFELMFDSGESDGIYNPEFLRAMDEYQQWFLKTYPEAKIATMVNTMKLLNQGFNGARSEEYRLPDDSKIAAEQMLFYSMERPPNLDLTTMIDIKNRYLRSTQFWNIQDSSRYMEESRIILDKVKSLGLKASITGREFLYNGMNDYVVDSYFTSIFMTILIITFMMMFILKSFTLGLISMLPNLVPLIIGAGVIQLTGKNIDVGIVLVSSICYGIAIDDTIHFLLDYKRKSVAGKGMNEIFHDVLEGTGTALVTTTFVIVISFSVFWFAHFIPNYNFGVFSSLILTIALVTDLLLLPSLLYVIKNKSKY